MAELVTTLTSFVTSFIAWIGEFLAMVQEQPLLLVFVILAILGIVVRTVRSWIPS